MRYRLLRCQRPPRAKLTKKSFNPSLLPPRPHKVRPNQDRLLHESQFLQKNRDSGKLRTAFSLYPRAFILPIISGGEEHTGIKHRIVWGLLLTLVIGTLLVVCKTNGGADSIEALKSAMIIGALPFTMVMGLMCVSLTKALYRDSVRDKAGTTATKTSR